MHCPKRRSTHIARDITFGSLFAGIGGFDLGFERAGMVCKWQVEINSFCQGILEKRWPNVERYEDVRNCGAHNLKTVDLICGGFPCPPFSQAAHGNNVEKSLWPEFRRIVDEIRPRWVVIENVSNGGSWRRWLPNVWCDLCRLGYAVLPVKLRASQFGAPHRRERVFVVANSNGDGQSISTFYEEASLLQESTRDGWKDWGKAPSRALGVADGVSNRMDRLRALGNAVVPQVAEWIGCRIIECELAGDALPEM